MRALSKPPGGTDGQIIKLVDGKLQWVDSEPEITLERAVEILNEKEHNHDKCWAIWPEKGSKATCRRRVIREISGVEHFSEFEAIAIAEKYLRETK